MDQKQDLTLEVALLDGNKGVFIFQINGGAQCYAPNFFSNSLSKVFRGI